VRELKTLKAHAWAGKYHYGDGLGVNVDLSLAPKSGFVFTWHGCLGLYDLNYGGVEEADGRIRHKAVHGQPNIPSAYSSYLLKQPIKAEITSVKERRIEDSARITTVVLNAGSAQGV
jgi:hypothetical protein